MLLREELLGKLVVSDIRHLLVKYPTTIRSDCTMGELLDKISERSSTQHVYVVDEQKCLVGTLQMNTVVEYLFPFSAVINNPNQINAGITNHLLASDIMNCEPRYVQEDTLLFEMAVFLMEDRIDELPVVNDEHHIIGQVNVYEVIAAYLNELKAHS